MRNICLALAAALTALAAQCVSITENAVVSINLTGITGTYAINPGTTTSFGPPQHCVTISSADYVDSDFKTLAGARVYDIQVQTIGAFPGSVIDGRILANGVAAARYSGSWSAFNTPQSLLTSPLVTRESAGIAILVAAVENQEPVTLCGAGSLDQPIAQTGLAVQVEVFGQVDAEL